jgi:archaellum biogenesis ATPase FlaH
LPSKEAIFIDLSNKDKIDDKQFETCKEIVDLLKIDTATSLEWLYEETEKFSKNRAIYLALLQSIQICDDKENKLDRGAIPDIMTKACSISFDNNVGHDYFENAEDRFNYYHQIQNKIPFNIDILNKITKGGVSQKTLTILMAGPAVGKSLIMCAFAAHNLLQGKNVLYITLEMSAEMITQRIDENLLDLDVDSLLMLPKEYFLKKINNLKSKTTGKLVVKEYPTRQAGSANFRAVIKELKLKKNFVPDIIYIDYLNICISSTIRTNNKGGLYEYVKVVGEEIRGLGVEFSVPIITATQFNRTGYSSSDPGMEDVSESFGTAMTADYIWALITSEELERENQLQFVQIKNRYGDVNHFKKFLVGINRAKMQIYNLEVEEQNKQAITKDEKERFSSLEEKESFHEFI